MIILCCYIHRKGSRVRASRASHSVKFVARPNVSVIGQEDGLKDDDGYDKVEFRPAEVRKIIGRRSIKVDKKEQVNSLPHVSKREVPRSSFIVTGKIGSGNFGEVSLGVLYGLDGSHSETMVAIKSIKGDKDSDFNDFLQEIKVMSYIKPDLNLVSMIASCSTNENQTRELWLILEYCGKGDLKDFLLKNKKLILCGDDSQSINDRCLLHWVFDIAKGMEHLSSNNIMHGDLAVRNILLAENPMKNGRLVAKVADFGLSKRFYTNAKYEKENRLLVPWKWMALELLTHDFLTLTSDVWSFGIVTWEIFSFGRVPYGQVEMNEVIAQLEDGYRLPCPTDITNATMWSPERLYRNIAEMCFTEDPDYRANFTDVIKIIKKELTEKEISTNEIMQSRYQSNCGDHYLQLGK